MTLRIGFAHPSGTAVGTVDVAPVASESGHENGSDKLSLFVLDPDGILARGECGVVNIVEPYFKSAVFALRWNNGMTAFGFSAGIDRQKHHKPGHNNDAERQQ